MRLYDSALVASRLSEAKRTLKVTTTELSREIGFGTTVVSRILNDSPKSRNPSIGTLLALCDALGVSFPLLLLEGDAESIAHIRGEVGAEMIELLQLSVDEGG